MWRTPRDIVEDCQLSEWRRARSNDGLVWCLCMPGAPCIKISELCRLRVNEGDGSGLRLLPPKSAFAQLVGAAPGERWPASQIAGLPRGCLKVKGAYRAAHCLVARRGRRSRRA